MSRIRITLPADAEAFETWLKLGPCDVIGCDSWHCDPHHLTDVIDPRTGVSLARRSGPARFACLRLCRPHHLDGVDAIHNLGTRRFEVTFLGGEGRALGRALGHLALWVQEGCPSV